MSMELMITERRGMRMLFSELKCREVINVCTGERYGNVCDLAFDPCTGEVQASVVPGAPLVRLGVRLRDFLRRRAAQAWRERFGAMHKISQ